MTPERIGLYVLWLTPATVRAVLALFMLRKGLHRQFPAFFAYTVYHLLKSGAMFVLVHVDAWAAFYAFWTAELFSFLLGFAVIYEVLRHVLRPYDALWSLGRNLFLAVAGLLVIMAAASTINLDVSQDHNALMSWLYATERSLRIVQFGLLNLLLMFSAYFGITWRHRVFGIALGFGVYVSVELAATAVRSEVGWIGDDVYRQVRMVVSACSILIWAAYLLRPEPARVAVGRVPHTQVEQWNQAVQGMWQR